jgi:hypothetical protein
MINKSFRLSKGFWHKFLPDSKRLLCPQNIPIEIWDIIEGKRIGKFHPKISCIRNITLSNKGDIFIFRGGCIYGKSEFKLYDTNTLNGFDEFTISEECSNPVFSEDDKNVIFGTWDGNIYWYNLEEKNIKKCFFKENYMFSLINTGKNDNGLLYIATSGKDNPNNCKIGFIVEYDIVENTVMKLEFYDDNNPYKINGKTGAKIIGLSLYKDNLAIMTAFYKDKIDDKVVHEAQVYVYNINTRKIIYIKENIQIQDVFYEQGVIIWSIDGKLSFIGLKEVYIIEAKNNYLEKTIPFDMATSVEFSNCGTGMAIGGNKAKIIKI